MKEKKKSRSADLWYTTEDKLDDVVKWHESYYETSACSVLWNRWSDKVAQQLKAYERDIQDGASRELIDARIGIIFDLLDDLKLVRLKNYDGDPYLGMQRRFL